MVDTELCEWCGSPFPADDALFDTFRDPVTGQGKLVTACSSEHLLALGQQAHEPRRRRRLPAWRRSRRRLPA
ncbi:MAG TPA: hypothetical protein VGL39_07865 [Jatrophihabitantaceae bacterium]